MMYGMKKSDEALVPLKAANKGAQAPARVVNPEGRACNAKYGISRDQTRFRYRDHGVREPKHVCTSSAGTWEVFIPPAAVEPGPQREGGFRSRWCTE